MPVEDVRPPTAVAGGTVSQAADPRTGGTEVTEAAPDGGGGSTPQTPTATAGTGSHVGLDVNIVGVGGGLTTSPAPPVAPATYIASTSLASKSGATWLAGPTYTLPSGLRSVSWVISWSHGGPLSQFSYRIRLGHSSGAMGVQPIDSDSASVSGAVATQTEYQRTVTFAEVGLDVVRPITYENTAGFSYIALDVQQAAVDGGGDGSVAVTVAGS